MGSPEMIAKYNKGPVGIITIMQNGPPAMGKQLGLWFAFSLLVGVMVAYMTTRTVMGDAEYLAVFRVARHDRVSLLRVWDDHRIDLVGPKVEQ